MEVSWPSLLTKLWRTCKLFIEQHNGFWMQIKSSVQVTSKIYQVISASKLQVVVGTKSLHNLKERIRNILRMCLEDTFYVYHRARTHYIVFFLWATNLRLKSLWWKKVNSYLDKIDSPERSLRSIWMRPSPSFSVTLSAGTSFATTFNQLYSECY